MNNLLWFFIGVACAAIFAFFGGSKYISQVNQEQQNKVDSILNRNRFTRDSLGVVIDSLDNEQIKLDTVYIKLKYYEKIYLDDVDTMPDSSIIRAIKRDLFK